MGGPEANRVTPGREAVRVIRAGMAVPWPTPGQLVLEDGSRRPVGEMLPADLPLGYHDFHPTAGDWRTRIIVTPWQCVEPRAALLGLGRAASQHAVAAKLGHRRPGRPEAAGRVVGRTRGRHDAHQSARSARSRRAAGSQSLLSHHAAISQSALSSHGRCPRGRAAGPATRPTGRRGPRAECLAAIGSGPRLPSQAAGLAGDLGQGGRRAKAG